jgi:c-di-GMP-binding flagellar brake protein YcgR
MSVCGVLTGEAPVRVFHWAASRNEALTVSLRRGTEVVLLRSAFLDVDDKHRLLRIVHPQTTDDAAPPEIVPGERIGIAFRRGHKKCVFTGTVAALQRGGAEQPCVIVAMPDEVDEFQRRAYQRVVVPADRVIAVRVWQGTAGDRAFLTGALHDLSAGGVQIYLDGSEPPRLRPGSGLVVELPIRPGEPPLRVRAAHRHTTAMKDGRVALGVQFVGLELEPDGIRTLRAIARTVCEWRRGPE